MVVIVEFIVNEVPLTSKHPKSQQILLHYVLWVSDCIIIDYMESVIDYKM